MSRARLLRELLLWGGAGLGVLAVACWLATTLGGFGLLVFRSGSMSPEIETGALAVTRTVAAADLHRGDVVSVVAADGARVTHRVVSSTLRGDRAELVLKGDANARPDEERYTVGPTPRVVADAPYAGYVLVRLLSPPGVVAVAAVVAMLLVLGFTEPQGRTDRAGRPRRRAPARRRAGRDRRRVLATLCAGLALTLVGTSAVLLATASGTWALFTDPASMSAGTFTSGRVSPPTAPTCNAGAGMVRWTVPATGVAPSSYLVTWSGVDTLGGTSNGTTTVTAPTVEWTPPAAQLFSVTYTVTVQATAGTWVSTPSTPAVRIRRAGVLAGSGVTCP